ncbi:MAG: D-alanyl-D-alanine carboxypeptidase [Gammaproteobacteria bacterium]|nr:D-alanyl-D-alanine carboxypeptidase [Gammaproteobacteria bacterium]
MPPIRTLLLLPLLSLLLANAALAASAPPAPQIKANGYILMDFASGNVLAELDADKRLEPASLTKIMTAYVVFRELAQGRLALTDQVRVSDTAYRMTGSRMFIEVNKDVSVEDLLRGMIIQSGNDASVALAERVAGSEQVFADLMNQQAKRLGMTGTHFTNCSGLPDVDHYTTARDIAILTSALIREFPDYYKFYSERSFTYNGIKQHNRNKLLWKDDTVDGVKTGYTEAAGYCLVSSAKRGDSRLISVLLGAASPDIRINESHALLTYGFNFFETHRLYQANQALAQAQVRFGDRDLLPLGLSEDLWVSIPRGSYPKLKPELQLAGALEAPIAKGQTLAEINLMLDGKLLRKIPVIALEEVAEGGVFSRMIDTFKVWME